MKNKIVVLKFFIGSLVFFAGMFSFAHTTHAFSLTFNVNVKYDSFYPHYSQKAQTFNFYIQKSSASCSPTVLMEGASTLPPCGVVRSFSINMPANAGSDATSPTYTWTYTSATSGTYYVNQVQRIGWSSQTTPFWSSFSATGTYNVNYINIYRPQMLVSGTINQSVDTVPHTWSLQVEEWNGSSWIGVSYWNPVNITIPAGQTMKGFSRFSYNFEPGRHRIRLISDTTGWTVVASTRYDKQCEVAAKDAADYNRQINNQVTGPVSSNISPEFNFVWETYRQGNYSPYEPVLFQQTGTVTFNLTRPSSTVSTSAIPASGGSFSPTSQIVTAGTSASFEISANSGYALSSVTDNCSSSGTKVGSLNGNTYTVTPVQSCTVTAYFGVSSYLVSTSVTPSNSGNFNPLYIAVSSGTPASFTFTPFTGYNLTNITDNCGASGASIGVLKRGPHRDSEYNISNIIKNCTVTATLIEIPSACQLVLEPTTILEGGTVQVISGGASRGEEALEWDIDWGDQSAKSDAYSGVYQSGWGLSHRYNSVGNYKVKLTASSFCSAEVNVLVKPETVDYSGEVSP